MKKGTQRNVSGIAFEIGVHDLCNYKTRTFRFTGTIWLNRRRNVNITNTITA